QSLKGELDQFSVEIRQLVLADSDDFQDALLILKEEKSKVEGELNMLMGRLDKLHDEKSKSVTKMCDKEFLTKFQNFFGEFERLSNCDKKLLLKSLMPKVIVHADFRIEIKVNRVFGNLSVDGNPRGSGQVRMDKRWLGWSESNRRPID